MFWFYLGTWRIELPHPTPTDHQSVASFRSTLIGAGRNNGSLTVWVSVGPVKLADEIKHQKWILLIAFQHPVYVWVFSLFTVSCMDLLGSWSPNTSALRLSLMRSTLHINLVLRGMEIPILPETLCRRIYRHWPGGEPRR